MRKSNLLLLVAVAFITAGCLQTRPNEPLFFAAPKPPQQSEMATLYLLRMGFEQGAGGQTWFYVNDKSVFNSHERTFSWVQVPPGEHTVKVQVGFWDYSLDITDLDSPYNRPKTLRVKVEPGEVYYVRYERINGPAQTRMAYSSGVFYPERYHDLVSERLFLEDPEKALSNLQHCVYMKNSYEG